MRQLWTVVSAMWERTPVEQLRAGVRNQGEATTPERVRARLAVMAGTSARIPTSQGLPKNGRLPGRVSQSWPPRCLQPQSAECVAEGAASELVSGEVSLRTELGHVGSALAIERFQGAGFQRHSAATRLERLHLQDLAARVHLGDAEHGADGDVLAADEARLYDFDEASGP